MARIAGINIPLNKTAEIGLTYIHGIGRSTANKVLAEADVEADRKVKDLTEDEVRRLR
jgi:small subunit ribosomal protein S13